MKPPAVARGSEIDGSGVLGAMDPSNDGFRQFDPARVFVLPGIYLVVNTVVGNIVEPMVVGQQAGLSSLAVFLSSVFTGWTFGAGGMLLSVPPSMVIRFAPSTPMQNQTSGAVLLDQAFMVSRGCTTSHHKPTTKVD
jgi:hypothetical protein